MRVMVMTKGDAADEGNSEPTTEMFEKMRAFNEQLVNAGIMLGGLRTPSPRSPGHPSWSSTARSPYSTSTDPKPYSP
nr:hypothetical protein GCM10020063_000580 [Dactylosporangium thailandense]